MANQKGSRQLKHSDRIRLEALYNAGHKVAEIAEILHVHRSTIYNELKRGRYEHLNSDYTTEMRYSSDLAQRYAGSEDSYIGIIRYVILQPGS